MSIRAMNWAWAREISPTPKLILMALADAANHVDECWPGIPFVAERCCVSERTVQRVLREFEATKLLSIRARFTAKGRRTSNVYCLHIDGEASPDNLSPSKAAVQKHDVILSGTGVTSNVIVDGDKLVSPLEPPMESEQQPLQFPHRLSAAEKLAIAKQLVALPFTDAQAMLDELADAMATATIKTNSLRWFSGLVRKQKSGAFVPTGGIRIAERRKKQPCERDSLTHENAAPKTDSAIARASLQQMKILIRTPARTAVANSDKQDREDSIGGGAAIAAVAGGAAAFTGGTANSVGGAVKAGSAAINNASAAGAAGIGGSAVSTAHALGSPGMDAASDAIKRLGKGSSSVGGGMAERISTKTASINEANIAGAASAASVSVSGPAATPAPCGQLAKPSSAAPNNADHLACNLANETKQADSAQTTEVSIQAPEHE